MNRLSPLFVIMLVVPVAGGCTRWNVTEVEKKPWKLPAPRMSPSTVVLELAFVRLNPERPQETTELWREFDEQILPTELRRRLNTNGMRCGMVGSNLPPNLQRLLDNPTEALDVATQDPEKLADDVTSRQYRLQSREGVRTPIAASSNIEKLHVFVNEDGALRGETYQLAQCMFSVRTYPQGDGRVQLEVVPEIEHGQPVNRRVGQEGIWRLEFSRDRKIFDALRLEVVLSPGDVLAISATPEPLGLGQSFFVKGPQQTTMLLIRLAQTQKDELFEDPGL